MYVHKDGPEFVIRPTRYRTVICRYGAIVFLVWLAYYAITATRVNPTADVRSTAADKCRQSVIHSSRREKTNLTSTFNLYKKHRRKTKIVLLWTGLYSQKSDWLPSTADLHCAVPECAVTSDRELLQNSSAVIFHWRSTDTSDLPPRCSPSKDVPCPPWVLYNRESPPYTNRIVPEYAEGSVFWTATYRRNSDIYAPYGEIGIRKTRNFTKPEFDSKKRLVCWLVSHCHTYSKREVFAEELGKYIEIDKYGSCGNMTCPHALAKDCYSWLSNKCLFYLSLENSLCRDYVTEKLYYALDYNMVPVVLGDNRNYRHLPRHSFINAADYSSPKQLAEYLEKVGRNKTLYESYMSWKEKYEVLDPTFRWFCDLCQKLHDGLDYKPHEDLAGWWYDQSECFSWSNSKRLSYG